MKKQFIIPAALIAMSLTSCGGAETTEGGTTDSTKTEETVVVEETGPIEKDYNYFSSKLDAIQLDGLTLTTDLVNDDANNQDLRRSWTLDPATAGCDKIQINTYSLSRLGNNRASMEYKSLQQFQDGETANFSEGVAASDFKEYIVADSLAFYYCTLKGCNDGLGGKKDYNQYFIKHFTANVGITAWVQVYDKNMDMTKAEEVAIKVMEYLAKP